MTIWELQGGFKKLQGNGKSSKIRSHLYLFLYKTFRYLTLNARHLTGHFNIRFFLLLFTCSVVAGCKHWALQNSKSKVSQIVLPYCNSSSRRIFFFFSIFHKIIRCLSRFWNYTISKTDFFHVWAKTQATVLLFLWACFWSDKVVFFYFNF